MGYEIFHSSKLNLVLEYISGESSVTEILEMKSISANAGHIKAGTVVLVVNTSDMEVSLPGARDFAKVLKTEMPVYVGVRTAMVTNKAHITAGTMMAAQEISKDQSMQVFSTVNGAARFLDIELEELLGELPEVHDLIKPFIE